MSFLLDTDICSTHMRQRGGLFHRFVQYSGRLFTRTVNLGELYAWAYKQDDPSIILKNIEQFLRDVRVLPFDEACALKFGQLHGMFLRRGQAVAHLDLLVAAIALTHDLTLVTHNVRDFQVVPDLRIEDWLQP